MTGKRSPNAVSGTDQWSIRVQPFGDRAWSWSIYPPAQLAHIGGAYARHGRARTRWGAGRRAARALREEKRLIARQERRRAAAYTRQVRP